MLGLRYVYSQGLLTRKCLILMLTKSTQAAVNLDCLILHVFLSLAIWGNTCSEHSFMPTHSRHSMNIGSFPSWLRLDSFSFYCLLLFSHPSLSLSCLHPQCCKSSFLILHLDSFPLSSPFSLWLRLWMLSALKPPKDKWLQWRCRLQGGGPGQLQIFARDWHHFFMESYCCSVSETKFVVKDPIVEVRCFLFDT